MKKISLLVMMLCILCGITACGGEANVSDDEYCANSEKYIEEKEERSKVEKLVDEWLNTIHAEYEYDKCFDSNTVSKENAESIVTLSENCSFKVIYEAVDCFMIMVYSETGKPLGYLGFIYDEQYILASYDYKFQELILDIRCANCEGLGQVISGSHIEHGQYACGGCAGSGGTWSQYFDGTNWQEQFITCGICAGTGWQNGQHTVYDYTICNECDGLGVILED